MCEFIIAPGTEAIVIGQEQEWSEQNFRKIVTTRMNTFPLSSVIFHPADGGCIHRVPNAERIGTEFAKKGYLGFLHGGYCIIVQADNVYVDRNELREEEAA